ncbi:MAG: CaiB/BaiF CoA transferase family protein [Dehalococcoidia bacterium]
MIPGALEGVRVLDNGIVQAGTLPARLLADFGAEVVRVENYLNPDRPRTMVYPDGRAREPFWENGGTYHEQHRNKAFCIGLDVHKATGREAFLRLAAVSDIVLDSHPPGVLDRLGLGYPQLRVRRPDVIYVTTSGYGIGGPLSSLRSYGTMTEIMCGSGWLNGYPGEGPRRGGCPLTDHPSTYHAAFAMMAALIHRDRTGHGTWLDISQYEIGTTLMGDAITANSAGVDVPVRVGSVDPDGVFSGCFECEGEGQWVTISASGEAAVRTLSSIAGGPDERSNLAERVALWTRTRGKHEAAETLARAGVAAAPVNDPRDLLLDEHLAARGAFWLVDHAPEQNVGRRAWPAASARLSATPGELRTRAPMLGEHNRLIALELLGFTSEEYEAAAAEGAFGTRPATADTRPPDADVLGRVAAGSAREVDTRNTERLRARFGDDYGYAGNHETVSRKESAL